MINLILRIDCDRKNFHKFVFFDGKGKIYNSDKFNNMLKAIKEDEGLTFDDKYFIMKVLSRKGIERAVDSVCKIYDSLCDDEKEQIDLDGGCPVYDLKYADIEDQFMRCVYFDDSKYDTKVRFGKNGTKISLISIYDDNFFPTKEEWKKIRTNLTY